MKSDTKTLALVLAGGAGTRAGGLDKGLIEYQGKALVQHVVDALLPQVDELAIAVHRNMEKYQLISNWVVSDLNTQHEGPIAGIEALYADTRDTQAINHFDYLLLASCDVPNLPADYHRRLSNALQQENCDVAVAHDGDRKQNLHCLIRTDLTPSLLNFYADGGRAMHRWFETISLAEVDFRDSAEKFSNFNTIEQMRETRGPGSA